MSGAAFQSRYSLLNISFPFKRSKYNHIETLESLENPLSYRILPEHNCFVVVSQSHLRFEDILEHVEAIMEDSDFVMGMNGFYDFRPVQFLAGNVQRFLDTAEQMNDHSVITIPARTAILVPEEDESIYKVFHGYEIMTSGSLIDYRVFWPSQLENALNFLGIPRDCLNAS